MRAVVVVAGLVACAAAGCSDSKREASDLTVKRATLKDKVSIGTAILNIRRAVTLPDATLPEHTLASTEFRGLNAGVERAENALRARFGNKDPRVADYSEARANRYSELFDKSLPAREELVRKYGDNCIQKQAECRDGRLTAQQAIVDIDAKTFKVWAEVMAMHDRDQAELLRMDP